MASDWPLRIALLAMTLVVGTGVLGSLAGEHPRPANAEVVTPATTPAARPDGFAAGAPSAPPAAVVGAGAGLSLIAPTIGSAVDGAIIGIRGATGNGLDSLLLAAVIGDAEIGRATIAHVPGGDFRFDLPVFAPPVAVEAELLAVTPVPDRAELLTAGALRGLATARSSFQLRPDGPVGLWPSDVRRDRDGVSIRVSGSAPLELGTLVVRLVGRDGRPLDRVTTTIAREDALAGARGGLALGLGSFAITLTTAEPVDGVRVEVDWRDPLSSSWGTSVQRIDLGGLPERRGA